MWVIFNKQLKFDPLKDICFSVLIYLAEKCCKQPILSWLQLETLTISLLKHFTVFLSQP